MWRGSRKAKLARFATVLIENSRLRVLEDRVPGWVSGLELLLDLRRQLVGSVLGLPPAARQPEFVANGAIGNDALAAGISGKLRYQRPAAALRGFVEKSLERSPHPQLMRDVLVLKPLDVAEICLDDGIARRQVEHRLSIVAGPIWGQVVIDFRDPGEDPPVNKRDLSTGENGEFCGRTGPGGTNWLAESVLASAEAESSDSPKHVECLGYSGSS